MRDLLALGIAVAVATVSGCGTSGGRTPDGLEREVLVSAAASLADAFAEIETAFESAHPGVDVVVNLAASSALREQIVQGAPVDVFASADVATMDSVVAAGRAAGIPVVFAGNLPEIAVPAGNPGGVTGLADLGRTDLVVGLCAEQVPCGVLAREALRRAGVVPAVDTNEANVRALLTKIELGEIDAGIVYATDVLASRGTVNGIPIPGEPDLRTRYPLVVLTDAPHPQAAAAFVAFVLSERGQSILSGYGFSAP